ENRPCLLCPVRVQKPGGAVPVNQRSPVLVAKVLVGPAVWRPELRLAGLGEGKLCGEFGCLWIAQVNENFGQLGEIAGRNQADLCLGLQFYGCVKEERARTRCSPITLDAAPIL